MPDDEYTNPADEEEQPSTSGKADFPQPLQRLDPMAILMDDRGPVGWRDPNQPVLPIPAWARGPYPGTNPSMSPNVSTGPSLDAKTVDDFIPEVLGRRLAALRSIDLNEEVNRGKLAVDPLMNAAYLPKTPLGTALGSRDLDRLSQRFSMPEPERNRQMRAQEMDMRMAERMKELPDYLQKDLAALMANKSIQSAGNTKFEGKRAPTQADIDKLNEMPTDSMVEAFDEQFGDGATGKYLQQGEMDRTK
jgi:hypothetical protein